MYALHKLTDFDFLTKNPQISRDTFPYCLFTISGNGIINNFQSAANHINIFSFGHVGVAIVGLIMAECAWTKNHQLLPLDEAVASGAVFVIMSGSDGRSDVRKGNAFRVS